MESELRGGGRAEVDRVWKCTDESLKVTVYTVPLYSLDSAYHRADCVGDLPGLWSKKDWDDRFQR